MTTGIMKKTLVVIMALAGVAVADSSVDFRINRAEDDSFSFTEDADVFALAFDSFAYETGGDSAEGYLDVESEDGYAQDKFDNTFSPNVQLRFGEDDYWTIKFSVTNTGKDTILLTKLSLEMFGLNNDGKVKNLEMPISTELCVGDNVQTKETTMGYLRQTGGSIYFPVINYHYEPVITTYDLPNIMLGAGESTKISLTMSNIDDEYNTYAGINNGSIGYKMAASVPEPATTTLSLLALSALAVRRRRR